MTNRVLLVRHGQTALNAQGRLRGLADPDLDPAGLLQVSRLAHELARRGPVGRVVSSPLHRAQQTAELIASASGAALLTDARFNDRDYGPWTGEVKADVIREWGSVDDAPGVEPEGQVLARALQGLDALTGIGDVETVAVVTHDAVIRPLLASIEPDLRPAVETASWAELAADRDGWTIVSVDNAAP